MKRLDLSKHIELKVNNSSFLFIPGVFFVLVGAMAVFAPGLLIAIVASVFLFVGLLLSFLAWKFLKFKKKVDEMTQQFSAHVNVVKNSDIVFEVDPEDIESQEVKKIIYH